MTHTKSMKDAERRAEAAERERETTELYRGWWESAVKERDEAVKLLAEARWRLALHAPTHEFMERSVAALSSDPSGEPSEQVSPPLEALSPLDAAIKAEEEEEIKRYGDTVHAFADCDNPTHGEPSDG